MGWGRARLGARRTGRVFFVLMYVCVRVFVRACACIAWVWRVCVFVRRGVFGAQAVAYDNPVPGYDTFNTINLRLWKATPAREFDFASFNSGDYLKARTIAQSHALVLFRHAHVVALRPPCSHTCSIARDVRRRRWRSATAPSPSRPSCTPATRRTAARSCA